MSFVTQPPPVSQAYVDAGDAASLAAAIAANKMVGVGYMDSNVFGSGVVSGDITGMSTDGNGFYSIAFNDQGGAFGVNYVAHITICGNRIWIAEIGDSDGTHFEFQARLFNPGLLAPIPALPSWDAGPPVGVAVTLYRI